MAARSANLGIASGAVSYVEGEVATGGTWIDGSPIYRYVFTVPSIVPGSIQTIATLKPNLRILKIDGSFSDGSDTFYFINHTIGFAAKLTSIAYISTNGTIQVYIQGGRPSNGIFIVEYIKQS